MSEACSICQGTGGYWAGEWQHCAACGGTGHESRLGRRPTSANVNIDPTSPCGDFDGGATENYVATDCLLARARCCRDWPVLAWTRMGRCGYCGEVPVVVGPW